MSSAKLLSLVFVLTTLLLGGVVEQAVASIQAGTNPDGKMEVTKVDGEWRVGTRDRPIPVSYNPEAGLWKKVFQVADKMMATFNMQRYSDGTYGLRVTPAERSRTIVENLQVAGNTPWHDFHEEILRRVPDRDQQVQHEETKQDLMTAIGQMLGQWAGGMDLVKLIPLPRWEFESASVRIFPPRDRPRGETQVDVTKDAVWLTFAEDLKPGTRLLIEKEVSLWLPDIRLPKNIFNDNTYRQMRDAGMRMSRDFKVRIPNLVVGEHPSVIPEAGSIAIWSILCAIGVTACGRRARPSDLRVKD